MSYDQQPESPNQEQPQNSQTPSQPSAEALAEPLTRNEREMMTELSTQAYGVPSKWQKLLKKGELQPAKITTANGATLEGKRLMRFTVQQVKEQMEKILSDRLVELELAQKKALEKANEVAQEPVQA